MEQQGGVGQPEMVRCEVTDQWVPADETVVIQGKRVSAQGKQILLDNLRAGHNIDDEMEAPTSLRRFGCAFLDGILMGLVGAALGAALGVALFASGGSSYDYSVRVEGLISIVGAAIGVLYFTLMHANGGQSLGKKAGKIKVVNLDGSDITFGTALVRALMFSGLGGLPALLMIAGGASLATAALVVNGVVGAYGLANCITVLASRQKRAIHDMIAKTRVIFLEG